MSILKNKIRRALRRIDPTIRERIADMAKEHHRRALGHELAGDSAAAQTEISKAHGYYRLSNSLRERAEYIVGSAELSLMEKKQAAGAGNDTGVLHETLVGHAVRKAAGLKGHMKHFRNEDTGKTPEQAHDELKKKVGALRYKHMQKGAEETAHHIIKHLKDHGHLDGGHKISDVHWTSNKHDVERLTGKADPSSKADIMISTKNSKGEHKYHGISLKHNVSDSAPNLANKSPHVLAKLAKGSSEHIKKIQDAHEAVTAKVYGKTKSMSARKEAYKNDLDSDSAGAKKRAKTVEASNDARTHGTAKHIADSINKGCKKDASHAHKFVKGLVASEEKSGHVNNLVAHTKMSPGGKHEIHVHDQDSIADEHMKHFDHKSMKAVAEGTNVHIYGKHKASGETRRVGTVNMKAQNSPCSGLVSSFRLQPHDKPIKHDPKTGATQSSRRAK